MRIHSGRKLPKMSQSLIFTLKIIFYFRKFSDFWRENSNLYFSKISPLFCSKIWIFVPKLIMFAINVKYLNFCAKNEYDYKLLRMNNFGGKIQIFSIFPILNFPAKICLKIFLGLLFYGLRNEIFETMWNRNWNCVSVVS